MAGTTKVLTFSEGVTVTAPAQSYLLASALSVYANEAAFVSAKGSAAAAGDIFFDSTTGTAKFYDGTQWVEALNNSSQTSPIGTIVPWVGGYFGDGSNGSFTDVLGNTVNDVNTYLGANWRVCDGSALNDSNSPIFNGASRYLPNLTDSRFLQGYTAVGASGGSNTVIDHTHTFSLDAAGQSHTGNSGSVSTVADHNHAFTATRLTLASGASTVDVFGGLADGGTYYMSDAGSHSHTVSLDHTHSSSSVSGTIGTGSAPSSTDNRPVYLNCFFIMRTY